MRTICRRAIDAICSHAHYYLDEGDVDPDFETIECPKHGSTFDLNTGKTRTLPATEPVDVFPVTTDDDDAVGDDARLFVSQRPHGLGQHGGRFSGDGKQNNLGPRIIARNFDYLPLVQPFYVLRESRPRDGFRSLEFTVAPLGGAVDGGFALAVASGRSVQ